MGSTFKRIPPSYSDELTQTISDLANTDANVLALETSFTNLTDVITITPSGSNGELVTIKDQDGSNGLYIDVNVTDQYMQMGCDLAEFDLWAANGGNVGYVTLGENFASIEVYKNGNPESAVVCYEGRAIDGHPDVDMVVFTNGAARLMIQANGAVIIPAWGTMNVGDILTIDANGDPKWTAPTP